MAICVAEKKSVIEKERIWMRERDRERSRYELHDRSIQVPVLRVRETGEVRPGYNDITD